MHRYLSLLILSRMKCLKSHQVMLVSPLQRSARYLSQRSPVVRARPEPNPAFSHLNSFNHCEAEPTVSCSSKRLFESVFIGGSLLCASLLFRGRNIRRLEIKAWRKRADTVLESPCLRLRAIAVLVHPRYGEAYEKLVFQPAGGICAVLARRQ